MLLNLAHSVISAAIWHALPVSMRIHLPQPLIVSLDISWRLKPRHEAIHASHIARTNWTVTGAHTFDQRAVRSAVRWQLLAKPASIGIIRDIGPQPLDDLQHRPSVARRDETVTGRHCSMAQAKAVGDYGCIYGKMHHDLSMEVELMYSLLRSQNAVQNGCSEAVTRRRCRPSRAMTAAYVGCVDPTTASLLGTQGCPKYAAHAMYETSTELRADGHP